jgi:hypothetical protein
LGVVTRLRGGGIGAARSASQPTGGGTTRAIATRISGVTGSTRSSGGTRSRRGFGPIWRNARALIAASATLWCSGPSWPSARCAAPTATDAERPNSSLGPAATNRTAWNDRARGAGCSGQRRDSRRRRSPHTCHGAHCWCRWCGQIKAREDFYASNKAVCADCFRRYRQAHYRLNGEAYVERNVLLLRQRRRRWLQRLWAYLTAHPCVDCGADDPRVLEFDHRDRLTKLDSLTVMAQQGAAWAKVEAEMAKCDVRCANCHRRRTAVQFDWPKRRISTDYWWT